jgi:hypothetical protein
VTEKGQKMNLELLNQIEKEFGKAAVQKLLTTDDKAIESYASTTRLKELNPDNCHELMDLHSEMSMISTKAFTDSLSVAVTDTGVKRIYSGNDRIRLRELDGKIYLRLGEVSITGVKKSAVIKLIIRNSKLFDTYTQFDWSMYIFEYNGFMYKAGFTTTADGALVSFMADYKPRKNETTKEQYYDKWEQNNNRHHQSIDTNKVYTRADSQYSLDDNITAFGMQQVVQTAEEYIAYIAQYKEYPEIKELIEAYINTNNTNIEG